MKIFPPKHPYYKAPEKVKDAIEVKATRKFLEQEAKNTLRSKTFVNKDFKQEIYISGGGITEFLNQPHIHYYEKMN